MRLLACAVLVLAVGTAKAQTSVFETVPGAPHRYREVTRSDFVVTTPDGPFPVRSFHDATISVSVDAVGGGEASYEALVLSSETPQGRVVPDTAPALGRPFSLRFRPGEHVQTTATPPFPESLEGVTDLRHQFEDFFLPPPPSALIVGLSWTDTLATATPGSASVQAGRYLVTGDTLIDGRHAVVVASHVESESTSTTPGSGPGVVVTSTLAGLEEGAFYVTPEGVLVGRRRRATLRGTLRVDGGPSPRAFPQEMRYESTITRL
jgi:hypothetical protein